MRTSREQVPWQTCLSLTTASRTGPSQFNWETAARPDRAWREASPPTPTPTPSPSTSSSSPSRSEGHTSELQSLMHTSYSVFCLKKKTQQKTHNRQLQLQNHNTT